ncbi:MAG: hypothetical protein ACMG57_03095 [Candidatus Dojkabacteria bacterium]
MADEVIENQKIVSVEVNWDRLSENSDRKTYHPTYNGELVELSASTQEWLDECINNCVKVLGLEEFSDQWAVELEESEGYQHFRVSGNSEGKYTLLIEREFLVNMNLRDDFSHYDLKFILSKNFNPYKQYSYFNSYLYTNFEDLLLNVDQDFRFFKDSMTIDLLRSMYNIRLSLQTDNLQEYFEQEANRFVIEYLRHKLEGGEEEYPYIEPMISYLVNEVDEFKQFNEEVKKESPEKPKHLLKKINWEKMGDLSNRKTFRVNDGGVPDPEIPESINLIISETLNDCIRVLSIEDDFKVNPEIDLLPSEDSPVMGVGLIDNKFKFLVNIGFRNNTGAKNDIAKLKKINDSFDSYIKYRKEKNMTELVDDDYQIIFEALLMQLVAHETYHARQYYQDESYAAEGVLATKKLSESTITDHDINLMLYQLDVSERSARSFAFRYIKEKIRQMYNSKVDLRRIRIISEFNDYQIYLESKLSEFESRVFPKGKSSYLKPDQLQHSLMVMKLTNSKIDPGMQAMMEKLLIHLLSKE